MRRYLLAGLFLLLTIAPLHAAPDAAAQIRSTLEQWTVDFNAGRTETVCGLFAPDLRYDFQGFPERDHAAMCNMLHKSMTDKTQKFHYALQVNEILVQSDMAVVRLVWTLTITEPGKPPVTGHEQGLDVFRKDADGVWRIVRFMGFGVAGE